MIYKLMYKKYCIIYIYDIYIVALNTIQLDIWDILNMNDIQYIV